MKDTAAMDIFSSLSLTPDTVLAGDSEEFRLTLVVGPDHPRCPTRLVLDFPGMLGQSRTSLDQVEVPGFTSLRCTNPSIEWTERAWNSEIMEFATSEPTERWKKKRDWGQRQLVIDLGPGLVAGDELELRWGDTHNGYGTGTKIASVVPKPDFHHVIDIRHYADQERGIPDLGRDYPSIRRPCPDAAWQVSYRVKPREPARLRLTRSARGTQVTVLDRFANVIGETDLTAHVTTSTSPTRNRQGGFDLPPGATLTAPRLPLQAEAPRRSAADDLDIFWGDLHCHSTWSVDALEREKMPMTPDDLVRFARDRANLDFVAITDHHIHGAFDHWLLNREGWEETLAAAAAHTHDGEYVVIPGYESGDARCDVNVYFPDLVPYEVFNQPAWGDIRAVWRGLAGRDFMTIPHFHRHGTLPEGQWWSPPTTDVEPVMEVYSTHGSYEKLTLPQSQRALRKPARFDRTMDWVLQQGHRYGVIGGSDGHKGHVGTSGLTAVLAPELTRPALFAAMRARHTYATTNARIRLVFASGEGIMGDILPNRPAKAFHLEVAAEDRLHAVDLLCGNTVVRHWVPTGRDFAEDLTINDPQPGYWQLRVRQANHEMGITSPIWFE